MIDGLYSSFYSGGLSGAGAAAPPPPAVSTVAKVEPPAFAPPPPIAPVVQTIASQIVQNATQANTSLVKDPFSFIDTQFVGATGTSYSLPAVNVPPSSVSFSILETDGRAKLEGGFLSIGKILGANTFTVRASFPGSAKYEAGVIDLVGRIVEDTAAMESANPARSLLSTRPSGDELKALDQFFYYTGKLAGTQGPASFYSTDYQNNQYGDAAPTNPEGTNGGRSTKSYFKQATSKKTEKKDNAACKYCPATRSVFEWQLGPTQKCIMSASAGRDATACFHFDSQSEQRCTVSSRIRYGCPCELFAHCSHS
jgi:hypothetical protein